MNTLAPWQQRAYSQALVALDGERLSHALLVTGAQGLGKVELARTLANRLLCRQPHEGFACGQCRSCKLLAAGTHPDLLEETFELTDKGEPRKEILIAQVRRLCDALMLTPQIAAGQVALIHPADALNRNAANALLKTLEEPPAGRHLILIADRPMRLPATIRSRCQVLRVDPPSREEALAWLVAQGIARNEAEAALQAAGGNPGIARRWLAEGGMALRASVARDLAALAKGGSGPVETMDAWVKDRPAQRLAFAAMLVREHLAAVSGAAGTDELVRAGLPQRLPSARAATWFDNANHVRAALETSLRPDLQIAELMRQWQELSR